MRELNLPETAVVKHGVSLGLQVDVPPTLPLNCKIIFVGEAGGREEAKQGEGWVGPAGRCLQRAAGLAGIEWAAVGKTNVAKRYTDKVSFKEAFYETVKEPVYTKTGKCSKRTKKIVRPTKEYQEWVDILVSELQSTSVNLIVACGNEALKAITELVGITDYRGSILAAKFTRSDGSLFKVLAVEHPSYIIRGNMGDFWILTHDLKKAKREMEFSEIRKEPWTCITTPSLLEAKLHLNRIGSLFKTSPWTLDVETRAGTLACFAVAYRDLDNDELISFCVPLQTTSHPYWFPCDELDIWQTLRETMVANPNLCNQNIEYDIDYLLRYGIEPSGVYMDTMLAHSILYPEFPKGLDFLCSFYLDDVVYYKWMGSDQNTGYTKDEELWERCCKDACFTLRIVDKIDEQLKQKGLYEFYHGDTHQGEQNEVI